MQTAQAYDKCEIVMHFLDTLKDSAVIWKFQHVNTFKSLSDVASSIQKGVELMKINETGCKRKHETCQHYGFPITALQNMFIQFDGQGDVLIKLEYREQQRNDVKSHKTVDTPTYTALQRTL